MYSKFLIRWREPYSNPFQSAHKKKTRNLSTILPRRAMYMSPAALPFTQEMVCAQLHRLLSIDSGLVQRFFARHPPAGSIYEKHPMVNCIVFSCKGDSFKRAILAWLNALQVLGLLHRMFLCRNWFRRSRENSKLGGGDLDGVGSATSLPIKSF